jgi:YD repeat-containing protein
MNKIFGKFPRAVPAMVILAISVFAICRVFAQQPTTTRYVYDDNGRLRAVITPSGEAAIYDYDSAGNITAIRRLGADGFELLTFAPKIGAVGDRVTLYGVNIGVGISSVTFNGVAAQIVESNSSKVVVTVPSGAVTGPITLTGSRGTATTASPFIVRGVGLIPLTASIVEGEQLQFTAMVANASGDQSVKWSVNGVEGGNATVGTISSTGLYHAPALPNNLKTVNYTVRATSVSDPDLFRDADVIVRNLATVRVVASTGVSILVREPAFTTSVASRGISLNVPASPTTTVTVVGLGLSVAVNLPSISSITPNRVVRGATTNISIVGSNLTGVTSLGLYTLAGALDSTISVTNLSVGGGGNSLTATITVNSNAALGRRMMVVATPTLPSLAIDSSSTTIEVASQ